MTTPEIIAALQTHSIELPLGPKRTALEEAIKILTNTLPKPLKAFGNTCNRHDDCTAADARARANGRLSAEHCHDDCCEECFGN